MVRFIIILVLASIVVALAWPYLSRLGAGRLPGDVVVERKGRSYFIPIATCVVFSLVLSALLWFFGH